MTTEDNEPTSMAEEVTKRVIEALRPEFSRIDDRFDQLTGELRSAKKDLGEDIDAINARMNSDKASIDEQLTGLRQDLNRHTTTTKSVLDSHTARFRTIGEKLDKIGDRTKTIVDRLDRLERIPAR